MTAGRANSATARTERAAAAAGRPTASCAGPRRTGPLLIALLALGCTESGSTESVAPAAGPPRAAPAATAPGAAAAAPAQGDAHAPIPLAELRAKVEDEVEAMRRLLLLGGVTGKALGEANTRLQRRAFGRRIPANPAPEALRSTLRQSAEAAGLVVLDVRCDPPAPPASPATPPPALTTRDRWTVDEEQMLGTIEVTIDLEGRLDAIAGWIDGLPGSTERFVWIRGAQRLGDRAVRLVGRAFFERVADQRQVEASWPSLEQWLRAAGHDPASPELKADPEFTRLSKAVQLGRELLPDVRSVLVSTNDLPRWSARARMFANCSAWIAAVDGRSVVGQLPDAEPAAAPAAP